MITPHDGSSLYYSLLWTQPTARINFLKRLTLIHALSSSLDDVQEPTVAEKKIHWWHEELERLAKSTPRHPACKENKDLLGGNQIAIRHCLSILSSAASTRYTQSQTDAEAYELLLSSFKSRLALLSNALHHVQADADDTPTTTNREALNNQVIQADDLALGFATHDNLYRLPYLLHRGFAVFSDETYDRHSLTPETLSTGDAKTILEEAINHTLSCFDSCFSDESLSSVLQQPAHLPLWRLAKLRAAQLKLWQRQGTRLVSERATLTPIRKFYIAWRHRRH